ncbi:MAG TPA: Ig-like domain-containing protein [Verrucomicrobiae bacterium]
MSNANPALFSVQPAVSVNGTLTYTPAPDANGTAMVTVLLKDNGGTANGGRDTSAPQTFLITILPVNDPPVAYSQSTSLNEDTPVALTLEAFDVDGDPLTYTIVTPPAHGLLSGAGSSRNYTAVTNYFGPDSFTFKVNDGQVDSPVATVSIKVMPVNDPPLAVAEARPLLRIPPNGSNAFVISRDGSNALVILDGSLSSDVENDPLQFLWLADGSLMPFADGVQATNVLPVGPHAVTLVVYDGADHGLDTILFEIITAGRAVDELIAFVDEANLSRKDKRPLLDKLKVARKAFADGKYKHGLDELDAFQKKVQKQIGRSDPALAQELIDAAQSIIEAFGGK